MAVTANQLTKRQAGERGNCPVAATTHLYEGTMAFFDGDGYLSGIVNSGANVFAGIMVAEADNDPGSAGDIKGEYYSEGDFELTGSGFAQTDVGVDIYATDNYTIGTSGSSTSYVGQCVGFVSSTKLIVRLKKNAPSSVLAGSATGTTAATFTVDSDLGKPRIAIGSQTGGTGDFSAIIKPPTTLTADRTFTLIGNADATLVNVAGAQTLTDKTLTSPILTTPAIGVATGASLAVTAGLTSSGATGAGIGYATGAGGAVSQATNRTTGVTLNTLAGKITTQATSLAAQTSAAFTVTNSTVALGDVVVLSIQSGPTGTKTIATVTTVAAGSFEINLFNTDASVADTGAAVINFAVLKAVAA